MVLTSSLSRRAAQALSFAAVCVGAACSHPDLNITSLDPEMAAREADSIRQSVAVQLAPDLELTLWASERLLADPVALDMDTQGRAWVTRTFRQDNSEFDIRSHPSWETASISFRSVEDRRAFLHAEFAPERSERNAWLPDLNADSLHDWRDLAVEKERVYTIVDSSGNGVADRAQIYVEGFDSEVTDVAGAILVHNGEVFLGVGPDMWRLKDSSGDGMADRIESISHGYAVHIGFGGHGMSGAIVGPDGRLYWGIGDIGMNVIGPDGRRWEYPNQGVIVRSNLDGTDFEVYAAGLRNTHEFAFDAYGNLISVDNDGDHPGESERVVYIVNGSDSGWRINWQFGKYSDPDNNTYKVWMDEELFKPRWDGQAAYITPPIALYHAGPTGLVYNPGTVLGEKWQNHFFVAEFTGTPARSRIFAFALEPDGATFRLANDEAIVTGILATGLDIGVDGALYFADWIDGWNTKDQGRIWRLDMEGVTPSDARLAIESYLSGNDGRKSVDELAALLRHSDMRVRQKAQFELVDRGSRGADALRLAAMQTEHRFARLHGIWGVGQLIRSGRDMGEVLAQLLLDEDSEIRAQAAKAIGDVRSLDAGPSLVPLLKDRSARVRFFATEALGLIEHASAFSPIIEMLEVNNDEDAYLRHAGALALARIGLAEQVAELSDHPSAAVRIAAVVALRRMQHSGVTLFLADSDNYIVTEAARAINDDDSIEGGLEALALVLERDGAEGEPLLRRAINANLRVGSLANATLLARFAAKLSAPAAMREEAIRALGVWARPSVLDRVDGTYRGEVSHSLEVAQDALAPTLPTLLADESVSIRAAAADAAGRLDMLDQVEALANMVLADSEPTVRIEALKALGRLGAAGASFAVALRDSDPAVRTATVNLVPELGLDPVVAASLLGSVIDDGTLTEQQGALRMLGLIGGDGAREILGRLLNQLVAGGVNPGLQLDVAEAVEASGMQGLQVLLEQYRTDQAELGIVEFYSETLFGGDPVTGRRTLFRSPGGQCLRCHAVRGLGGEIGPELTGIGSKLTREELLESLIDPGARIPPGYGTVALVLDTGESLNGLLVEETETTIVIQPGGADARSIDNSAVVDRQDGPSGMPPMAAVLSRQEIRDIIAYLVSLEG